MGIKKKEVLERLIQFVKEQQFKRGDKLPPERELSVLLNVSRTTLREGLRMLEARGILISRRGSGIYLNRGADVFDSQPGAVPTDEDTVIKDHLEARFLIIPNIASCAAERADENEIKELQDCIVRLSRAIVSRELNALAESEADFFRLLAIMTKNHKLVGIVEQLNTGIEIFWDYFIKSDEFVNNVIFAGYVEVVNAIKRRDVTAASDLVKRNIINFCEGLSRIKNIPCRDLFGLKKN